MILDDTKNYFKFKFLLDAPSTLWKFPQKLPLCQINSTQSLLVIKLPIIFSSQHQFQFHCRVWVGKSNFFYKISGSFLIFSAFPTSIAARSRFLFHKLFLIYLSSKEKVFLSLLKFILFYFGREEEKFMSLLSVFLLLKRMEANFHKAEIYGLSFLLILWPLGKLRNFKNFPDRLEKVFWMSNIFF